MSMVAMSMVAMVCEVAMGEVNARIFDAIVVPMMGEIALESCC